MCKFVQGPSGFLRLATRAQLGTRRDVQHKLKRASDVVQQYRPSGLTHPAIKTAMLIFTIKECGKRFSK